MTAPPEPERLNQEGFAAFSAGAGEEALAIGHLRTEALERGELHPMSQPLSFPSRLA